MMQRNILIMTGLSLLLFTFSRLAESVDIDSTVHKLPDLSIDHYKNELIEIQKLQRDNEKLKLEEQKIAINNRLKKLEKDDISATKIMSIYSLKSKFYAQIYNPYDGVKTVSQGSVLMKKYKVIKINPNNLILKNINNDSENIDIDLVYPGVTD